MTRLSMALSELVEKGADGDFLRQMVQYVAQRIVDMDMDVEGGYAGPAILAARSRVSPSRIPAVNLERRGL